MMDKEDKIIPPHGGYKNLKAYQMSEVVYDGTVKFCERFHLVPKLCLGTPIRETLFRIPTQISAGSAKQSFAAKGSQTGVWEPEGAIANCQLLISSRSNKNLPRQ